MKDWAQAERVLEQFRQWLAAAHAGAEQPDGGGDAAPPLEDRDFAGASFQEVVEAFTALRHELKLHTKSARGVQDQSAALIDGLRESQRRFDSIESDEEGAAQRAAQAYAVTLTNLDEALERGFAALEEARRKALDDALAGLRWDLDALHREQPWWVRWFTGGFQELQNERLLMAIQRQRETWDTMCEGYRLILNRLKRSLEAHGLNRIPTLGRLVDPHSMMVVEVVAHPAHPPGTVIAELRPGYLWKDKLLRCAEVRAVRPDV